MHWSQDSSSGIELRMAAFSGAVSGSIPSASLTLSPVDTADTFL